MVQPTDSVVNSPTIKFYFDLNHIYFGKIIIKNQIGLLWIFHAFDTVKSVWNQFSLLERETLFSPNYNDGCSFTGIFQHSQSFKIM